MKKNICALVLSVLFLFVSATPALAEEIFDYSLLTDAQLYRVVDEADLLSSDEEIALLAKVDEISERQQCDIVVVTVNSIGGKTAQAYADDYFDYNGYGLGEDRDGILMLISMEDRDWYVSTRGYGITAVTEDGLDYMSEKFTPYLSDGNYADACNSFADSCDELINLANEGTPYKAPFSIFGSIIIAFGFAFIISLIVTLIMRGKLKSVKQERAAANYVRPNSLVLTQNNDFFLYRNVTRTAIPKADTSSGGTHVSSSGATHGGGGGKF